MKTLIVIHCHSDVKETVLRHKPLWEAHGHEIIYFSPEDSRLYLDGEHCVHVGHAGHSGPVTNRRFRLVWSWAAAQPGFERVVFMEYDSVILTKEIPFWNDAMLGNRFHEPDHSRFASPTYFHAPWVWPMDLLRFAVTMFSDVRQTADVNYWDRWLGLLLTTHGIPNAGFGTLGFSMNTIGDEDIPKMQSVIRQGAVALHGVKTASVFDAVFKALLTR